MQIRTNIQYSIDDFDLQKKLQIINQAYILSYKQQIDKLLPNKFARERANDITFDKIMQYASSSNYTRFSFFYRDRRELMNQEQYFDIGFRTTYDDINLYLFLWVSVQNGQQLIKKFNIKKYY